MQEARVSLRFGYCSLRVVAVILLLVALPAAQAAQKCTPIRFARGTSSATVRGIASTDEPFACYLLTTAAGQTATLAIVKTSPADDTAFTIPGVVDNQDRYSFRTEAKTYTIEVYLTLARQPPRPFTMLVAVK